MPVSEITLFSVFLADVDLKVKGKGTWIYIAP